MRIFAGLNEIVRLAFDVHGPWQLLRFASCPTCLARQSRAASEPDASSRCMAAATCGSALEILGSKMNARSFEKPSPLTSPETTGVNGCPERNCPNQLTRTASQKLYPML